MGLARLEVLEEGGGGGRVVGHEVLQRLQHNAVLSGGRFQDTATGEMSRRTLRDGDSETTTFTGLPEGSTDERFDELWDRDTKRALGGPSSEKA